MIIPESPCFPFQKMASTLPKERSSKIPAAPELLFFIDSPAFLEIFSFAFMRWAGYDLRKLRGGSPFGNPGSGFCWHDEKLNFCILRPSSSLMTS
jgi:hypothetical protein